MSMLFAFLQFIQHSIDLRQLFWGWLFSLDVFGMCGPLRQFFVDLSAASFLARTSLRQSAFIVGQSLEHIWYQTGGFLGRMLANVLDVPF